MNEFSILTMLELPQVGRKTIKKVFDELNNSSHNLNLDDAIELLFEQKPKLRSTISLADIGTAKSKADQIISSCNKLGIEIIPVYSDNYPIQYYDLKADAPVILYAKGNTSSLLHSNNVAIIGTRNNTELAEKVGDVITKQFVDNDFFIVSGLAKGCDTIAHKSCIKYGGTTIAILANGLNNVYPKENQELAEQIMDKGCLLSEYAPFKNTLANFFVERDRLQSGLSKGIVVIETDIKGGTMHTVNFAKNQNRYISCVNYNESIIVNQIRGNRKLISEGLAFGLTKDNINEYIKLLFKKEFTNNYNNNKLINSYIVTANKRESNTLSDNYSSFIIDLQNQLEELIKSKEIALGSAKKNKESWSEREKKDHNKFLRKLNKSINNLTKEIDHLKSVL